MATNFWHKHFHIDALNSYAGMSLELRGAAYTLLDLIYDRQGPLVESDRMLAARMGVSLRLWKSIKRQLVELGKFALTDDGFITNKRAENELKTVRKHAENGAKGGRTKAENEKIRKAFKDGDLASLENPLVAGGVALEVRDREEPIGSSNEPNGSLPHQPKKSAKADDPIFEELWAAWQRRWKLTGAKGPRGQGKSKTRFIWDAKIRKTKVDPAIIKAAALDAIRLNRDPQFLPGLDVFLTQERWDAGSDNVVPFSAPKPSLSRAEAVRLFNGLGRWNPEWGDHPTTDEIMANPYDPFAVEA